MAAAASTLIQDSFSSLPMAEKLRVVQDLWDDIATHSGDEIPLSDEQRRVLDARLEAHVRDPSGARPWEVVRRELAERAGKAK